jgi:hypothetical protein
VKVFPKKSRALRIADSRATAVWGGVFSPDAKPNTFLARITGDYAGTIFLDETPVWNIATDFASRPTVAVQDELLPSDCRFRIDRAMLIQGDMAAAEEAKTLLESLQRHDAHLRRKE